MQEITFYASDSSALLNVCISRKHNKIVHSLLGHLDAAVVQRRGSAIRPSHRWSSGPLVVVVVVVVMVLIVRDMVVLMVAVVMVLRRTIGVGVLRGHRGAKGKLTLGVLGQRRWRLEDERLDHGALGRAKGNTVNIFNNISNECLKNMKMFK